jgi:hypothetical protein
VIPPRTAAETFSGASMVLGCVVAKTCFLYIPAKPARASQTSDLFIELMVSSPKYTDKRVA